MAANLGALTVSLGLDAADYTRGLTKAEKDAYAFGESIGSGIRTAALSATAALAALGVSAGAALAFLSKQTDQIANFQGLSEKIGDTAAAVQSLKLASDLSDVSLDNVATASVKLTAELSKTSDTSKGAGAAIKALGLDLKDFKSLSPTDQLKAAATALAGFEDNAGKTAVAVALFGKSGAELIPFLNDLAESGETNIRLTNDQIKAIDDHKKAAARLKSEIESLAQYFAVQSVDALTAFTGTVKTAITEMLNLSTGASDLGSSTGVQTFAESAGRSLASLLDYLKTTKGEFSALTDLVGAYGESAKTLSLKPVDDYKKKYGLNAFFVKTGPSEAEKAGIADGKTYVQKYDEQLAGIKRARFSANDPRRVDLNKPSLAGFTPTAAKAAGGSKDDPTKKLLDNQLKEYERAYKQEEDLLQARNKVLDLYYGQNLVSIEDYYASRQANQEEATTKEVALIDQQIAALEKYKAAAKKDTDRADAQGKINALLDKEADLQRKAGEVTLEQSIKKVQAVQAYKDAIDGVRASLLEMQGDAGAAAQVRVEIQYRDLLTKATTQNDEAAKRLITTLKEQTVAQANFNTQATASSQITGRLQIDEDRIAIARQLGTSGELDSLQKLGEARRKSVAEMKSIVEAQEAIAKASGNPTLILQADQARLALEKLAATADPLADKFNTMFSDAAGSAFSDFITGAKTAKEAFKSFTDSIFKELTNLIVKDLFKQLFSGGGSGTGGVGFNFGSLLSGLFGGGKAIGGSAQANTLYQVAENRPEMLDVNGKSFLMMGNQRGNIDPNPSMSGGGMSVVIHQSFAPGTSRQTTDQAAQQAGRAIERAQRRNG